jgi:acyl carrier protein
MLLTTGKEQMTEQEILNKLIPLIREVTGVREEQIKMDSCLMQDLGAESVDLLDFTFLIEEVFGVTIEADEFEQQARQRIPGGVYEKNGYLTAEALEELKKALPEVPVEYFKTGLKKIEVPSVLNVGVFVHVIQRKLDEKSQETGNA